MEDDEREELERVGEWIGRLKAFTAALDDIEGDDATNYVTTPVRHGKKKRRCQL